MNKNLVPAMFLKSMGSEWFRNMGESLWHKHMNGKAACGYEVHSIVSIQDERPNIVKACEICLDRIYAISPRLVDAITGLPIDFKSIITEMYWRAIDEDFGREAIGL